MEVQTTRNEIYVTRRYLLVFPFAVLFLIKQLFILPMIEKIVVNLKNVIPCDIKWRRTYNVVQNEVLSEKLFPAYFPRNYNSKNFTRENNH